jgi:hypothetical protein
MANGVWQNVIQNTAGQPVAGAAITVLDSDTGEAVDLFEDRDGLTPIVSLTTDTYGFARFYCRVGRVDISIALGARSMNLFDVVIIDDFPGA